MQKKIPTIPPELVEWLKQAYPEMTPDSDWGPEFIWRATRRSLVLELEQIMLAQQRRSKGDELAETEA